MHAVCGTSFTHASGRQRQGSGEDAKSGLDNWIHGAPQTDGVHLNMGGSPLHHHVVKAESAINTDRRSHVASIIMTSETSALRGR